NQCDKMLKVVRTWSLMRARMDDQLVDTYRELNRTLVELLRHITLTPEQQVLADQHNALLRQAHALVEEWLTGNDEGREVMRKRRQQYRREDKAAAVLDAATTARADADDGSDDKCIASVWRRNCQA